MDIISHSKDGRLSHRTGHTMRRQHYGDQHQTRYKETYEGQFTIHKTVVVHDEVLSQEGIEATNKVFGRYVDDGGLEAELGWSDRNARNTGIVYSQNKRKRWLLAQLLKDNICAVNLHEDLDFKVILEEREIIMSDWCPRRKGRPDCIRVCESKTDQPEKLPNQKYSSATDLRKRGEQPAASQQRNQVEEEEEDPPEPEPKMMELYYEMCYARPQEKFPWKKEASNHSIYYKSVNDKKAASKAKGQRNKRYSDWHGLENSRSLDQHRWHNEEEIDNEQEEYLDLKKNTVSSSSSASLGDVVAHLLKKSDKVSRKSKRCKKPSQKACFQHSISPNQASSSNPKKVHGKGTAIYEEREESSGNNSDTPEEETTSRSLPVPDDNVIEQDITLTSTLRISTQSILPSYLKNTFGSAYIECLSHPRRFAIDVAQNFTTTEGKVYLLFEMMSNKNKNNVCHKWHETEEDWQNFDVDQNIELSVSLIISPHFTALCESDFMAAMHAGSGEVHTVADVVRWLVDVIKEKMVAVNETNSAKRTSKYSVSMDTVSKANGWELKVDTPEGVYQELQQKFKDATSCVLDEADFVMEFSPFCGICYESLLPSDGGVGSTALNACGHWFCNECWTQHLRSRVKQGDFQITCPAYECKSALDIVTKMSLMSTPDFFRHLDHVRDAAINRKAEWQWCPNPKCGRMACVVAGQAGGVAVNCVCGWFWCSQCMQDAHWPATCKQAAGYRELMKGREPKSKITPIVSVEVKRCPRCNYPIEKDGGCPHMVCRMCATSFCWQCLGDWNAHGFVGINLKCPKSKVELQTMFFEDSKKTSYSLLELALHHKDLRTKSATRRYKRNAYRLTAKEFLQQESGPGYFNTSSHVLSGELLHCQIQEEYVQNLPITWTSTATVLTSLIEKCVTGQEYVKFCLEAHFVLEFLAIYLSDKTTKKQHRKQLNTVSDRLEFITQRLDEVLNSRSNLGQARLLTQAGKSCLEQLAHKMKNTQTVEETK